MADPESTPPAADNAGAPPSQNPWKQTWQSLPSGAKYGAMAIAAASILSFGLLLSGGSDKWKPISSSLSPEDLRAASASLEAKGFPYKVDEGTLWVEEGFIHDARLELAASTMPSGRSVGFELFDESELGRSAFAEKVNFNRALEGELARTIGHISPIRSARVHLVVPGDKLFREQETPPSAAVHVSLRPGQSLSAKQVNAIRHLVAGAVEKLAAGQVTIVDESGALIGGPRDPELEAADGVFEHQRKYEAQLEGKIADLLEPVVGVGGVKVKVSARIDYSHVVQTEDRVNPEEQTVVSERALEEQRSATDPNALGIPGMGTNTPDRNPPGEATTGQQLLNRTEATTNYQSSRSSKRVDQPRGRTEKLHVAVIVDNIRQPGPDGNMVVVPRGAEELSRYRLLVSNAVGLDESRGDTVEVIAETILRPNEDQIASTLEDTENKTPWALVAAAAAAGILLLGAIVWAMRSRRRYREQAVEMEREHRRLLELASNPPPALEAPRPAASEQVEVLRLQALNAGSGDIRRVASVFRSWIHEEAGQRQGA